MPLPNANSQNHLAADITDVLRNPYRLNQFQTPYSAHYASAYMQSQPAQYTTPEGYTLSSTYNPQARAYSSSNTQHHPNAHSIGRGRGRGQRFQTGSAPHYHVQRGPSWYKAGNARCTYPGCSFSGSPKSVEIHMMDRHLIYPPGWEKNKNQSDWDADPSLKGKAIPIQGTSVMLDTPEALDAWLAERKKRWPTAERVKETSVRMKEAIARGQLPPMNSNIRGKKRRFEEGEDLPRREKRFNNSEITQRPGPRTQPTTSATIPVASLPPPADTRPSVNIVQSPSEETPAEGGDDNEAPEVLSSKKPISPGSVIADAATGTEENVAETPKASQTVFRVPKRKEPRLPPRNPFASRPALLRNLLLPEIRITVSNLSQAIRFLVDNDFLQNVELKPGQANNSLIEVLDSGVQTNELKD